MERKNPYRIQFHIFLELEEKAREKAYDIGLIKGGKGIVSNYIVMLIMDDLKIKPKYKIDNIDFGKRKLINVTFPEERMDEVRSRAKELGFIKDNEGNVSEYINFLLSQSL